MTGLRRDAARVRGRGAPAAPYGLAIAMVLLVASLVGGAGCGAEDPLLLADGSNVTGTVGTVRGFVRSFGVPIPAAAIRTDPAGPTATTSATGQYQLEGVLPGAVTVIVERAGFQTGFARTVVLANRTSTRDVDLLPANGAGFLLGQVTDGQFGLEGVTISTVPSLPTQVTTADGRFVFTGAVPGQYTLEARRLGFGTVRRVVQVREGAFTEQDFALGRRTDGVLQGVVTDSAGAAIPNAAVELLFEGQVFTSFTNALGQYSFFNLTTGFYVLSVAPAGFLPGSKGLEVRGGSVANGDLVVYSTATPAPVPGSITGTVYGPTDQPLSNVNVTLSVIATPAVVLTGTDGRFTFVDVPTGGVSVTATPTTSTPGGAFLLPGMRTTLVASGQSADGSLNLSE